MRLFLNDGTVEGHFSEGLIKCHAVRYPFSRYSEFLNYRCCIVDPRLKRRKQPQQQQPMKFILLPSRCTQVKRGHLLLIHQASPYSPSLLRCKKIPHKFTKVHKTGAITTVTLLTEIIISPIRIYGHWSILL